MDLIYHPIFKEHDTGMHPENKKRLEVLGDLPTANIPFDESMPALVHGGEYIQQVKDFSALGTSLQGETHTSPRTYEAAVYAVNATILASQSNDMAVVRPPGHHAHRNRASGFCIFNNVAIAAQYHVNQGKKVLIFDFDGHLGDGTTDIFYDSPDVMYWSIHQYPAFPGRGLPKELGEGPGEGFTVNVPLPPGAADDIFMDSIESVLPVVQAFNPDIVAVSAGFDAHQYDLLLDLRVSVNTFYLLGRLLREQFPNVFATLEGGYSIEELPKCLNNFVDGFNGNPMRYIEDKTESDIKVWNEYEIWLNQLLGLMKKYWEF